LRSITIVSAILLITAVAPASLKSGEPIPVGGDGRGSLFIALRNNPLGVVRLEGDKQPSLLVVGEEHGIGQEIFLFRRVGSTKDGAPVFGKRTEIKPAPGTGKGFTAAVYQTPDNVIHGLWLIGEELVRTRLDLTKHAFVPAGDPVKLTGTPRRPHQIAATPNGDGSVALLFAVDDGTEMRPGEMKDWRSPKWYAYDGAGHWRGGWPYATLYGATLPNSASSAPIVAKRVSSTEREALHNFGSVTFANFGKGHERDVVGGAKFGNVLYYHNSAPDGLKLAEKLMAVGPDGVALRHPQVGMSPVAYANDQTGLSDLIAGGEGDLWYYRFSGKFNEAGAPIFAAPTPLLEQGANAFAGSLPVTNVADWDGDGKQDLVVGASTGRIYFLKNLGDNGSPSFAAAVPLQAGGEEICIQVGYGRAVQGPGEARWGYVSPTVFDWNGDGTLDIVTSSSTGDHQVYLNRGTRTEPKLALPKMLYVDGMDLHGSWRVKPGVAKVGDRVAYVALDEQDQFHLFWRIDDQNLRDGGKLLLESGQPIGANFLAAGGTGRSKINFVDWDLDGKLDLLVGTPRHGSIPDPRNGLPQSKGLKGAAVIFMKNVGTSEKPTFAAPVMMKFKGEVIYLGQHECGPSMADFGGNDGPDLIVGRENGKLMYYNRADLSWSAE
jgi:hypothetical protein